MSALRRVCSIIATSLRRTWDPSATTYRRFATSVSARNIKGDVATPTTRSAEEIERAVLHAISAPKPGDHVVVAMSGGVDSSVTALLLRRYRPDLRLSAIFMHNWDATDEGLSECTSDRQWKDVQTVCAQLAERFKDKRTDELSSSVFPCHRVVLAPEYWTLVFEPMLEAYRNGITPSPDLACNREVKFGVLWDKILSGQFSIGKSAGPPVGEVPGGEYRQERSEPQRGDNIWIATGHYAQVDRKTNGLLRAFDPKKDQTYFLANVSNLKLRRTLFPLGGLAKTEVRQIAQEAALLTANKKESMGICFIGQRKRFGNFLSQYLDCKPGDMVTPDGRTMGKHVGASCYTIGQRTKLVYDENKWIVADKNKELNQLIVVPGVNHPALFSSEFIVKNPFWIDSTGGDVEQSDLFRAESVAENGGIPLHVTIRSTMRPVPCLLQKCHSGTLQYRIVLQRPVRAIAPGQPAVLYQGERCLGSGIIDRVIRNGFPDLV